MWCPALLCWFLLTARGRVGALQRFVELALLGKHTEEASCLSVSLGNSAEQTQPCRAERHQQQAGSDGSEHAGVASVPQSPPAKHLIAAKQPS